MTGSGDRASGPKTSRPERHRGKWQTPFSTAAADSAASETRLRVRAIGGALAHLPLMLWRAPPTPGTWAICRTHLARLRLQICAVPAGTRLHGLDGRGG